MARDVINTQKVQSELVGLTDEQVKAWLKKRCGPFEYLSRDELVRARSHVPEEVLHQCSGRYRALLNRGDEAFKLAEKTERHDVDVSIFMAKDGKVFRVDFEIISDGL